ncbi:unnamed protein product [Lampetra fluviatilis]
MGQRTRSSTFHSSPSQVPCGAVPGKGPGLGEGAGAGGGGRGRDGGGGADAHRSPSGSQSGDAATGGAARELCGGGGVSRGNFHPSVTLITLNSEEDFPNGTWLGDEWNVDLRVLCPIAPGDLLHVTAACRTPEKMALTLLDHLLHLEVQAASNLSGHGHHGKKQMDPLIVYGIRCELRRAGSDFFRFLFFTSDSNLTTTSVEKGGNDWPRRPDASGGATDQRAKSVHQRGIGAVVTTYTPPLLIILLLLLLVLRSSARASRSSPAPAEVTDDASLRVRTVARQRAIDSSHGREP